MKKKTLLLFTALTLFISGSAQSDVTVFDNQIDYDAAVGPEVFFIDFNPSPEPPAYVLGDTFSSAIVFASPEASDPWEVLHSSNAITDAGSTIAPNGVGPMAGFFTSPVYAFALVFSSASQAETVYLLDESEVLIDAVTAPNPSGFFGVTSDTPINIFVIINGDFPGGDPDRFFVDDFRANRAPASVIKTVEGLGENIEADLGDHLTVTLVVDNPYSEDIVVEDVLPDGLAYIGNFTGGTPEVDGNIVATMVAPGETTINFDVQVVEVQYEDVIVVNTANVYDPDDGLDSSDSVDITLHPYGGLSKSVAGASIIVDGEAVELLDPWDEVPINTHVIWAVVITVEDIPDNVDIEEFMVKDNLGGDLTLYNYTPGDPPTVEPELIAYDQFFAPAAGFAAIERGKTKKVQMTWEVEDSGGILILIIGTDFNPGQGKKEPGKWEYTSTGEHDINSGATLKFVDPETGLLLSAHTAPLTVTAFEPEPE